MRKPAEGGRGASAGSSYGQIVTSSSLMGAVAAASLLLGMIRTKFAAVLIGTAGVGLLANFVALQSLVTTIAGFGIGASGVRDIARAHAAGAGDALGRTVRTLVRACWVTGVAGAAATAALSPWLSEWTFGSTKFQWHIAALGITVLFGHLTGAQMSMLQGTGHLRQLAKAQVLTSAVGTATSLACYFLLGIDGLVVALVLLSLITVLMSWQYARRVPIARAEVSVSESSRQAFGMARLGTAMMWTVLAGGAATYGINAVITREFDLHALGIYSAAFALSGMFVNFVLSAMTSDYYPRLSAVSDQPETMNRLVNEQTEVGLLLAVPGLLATITLAPWAIHAFYTRDFLPAADLLHWMALGCLGRIVSWPLSYLLMAMSKSVWLVACETLIHTLHVLLVYAGIRHFGLIGAGAAFFALYVLYTAMVYSLGRRLTNFRWSRGCRTQVAAGCGFMLAGWLIANCGSEVLATLLAVPCIAAAALHSAIALSVRLNPDHRLRRMLHRIPGVSHLVTRWTRAHPTISHP